jgi:hypothetical protein
MHSLFKTESFISHSGLNLNWKIECDVLTVPEWITISKMIMQVSPPFREAIGIPRGGIKLGNLLNQYGTNKKEDPICIVDDVLTSGESMTEYAEKFKDEEFIGWVVFARGHVSYWINALFRMPYIDDNGDLIKMIGTADFRDIVGRN